MILSGGLDSSLTLLHVREMHPDCVAFTIGAPGSEDLHYARRLCADLSVPHEVIELSPRQIGLAEIRSAIRISELTEYGDIINAVVSIPAVPPGAPGRDQGGADRGRLRRAVRRLRRCMTGPATRPGGCSGTSWPPWAAPSCSGWTGPAWPPRVEARVPFLDPGLVELALRLPLSLKVRDGQEKWILREAFAGQLPGYIRQRPKNPMSHSSGLHERARLYKPLFARIHRSLGYDRCAPVRRDFSTVLEACGNDLDRALAAGRCGLHRARATQGPGRGSEVERGAGRGPVVGSRRARRSRRSAEIARLSELPGIMGTCCTMRRTHTRGIPWPTRPGLRWSAVPPSWAA